MSPLPTTHSGNPASSIDAGTYLVDRIDQQLSWLSNSSKKSKQGYMRYRISGILLGALITVLAPYAGTRSAHSRWIPPILQVAGAGVAIAGSLLALNQHQENWLRYRLLNEALEREKMLYLTRSQDVYARDENEAFHEFVRRAEAIMAEERTAWSNQVSEQAQAHQHTLSPQPNAPTPTAAEAMDPEANPQTSS